MSRVPSAKSRSTRSNSVCSVESRRSSVTRDRFASKVKMGKKLEKAGNKEKNQSATSQDETDSNKAQDNYEDVFYMPGEEPHVCNGNFQADFAELCRRAGMTYVPPIVMRPRPLGAVQQQEASPVKGGKDKGKQSQPDPEPEVELTEDGEPIDAPPKTYTTKDKFEYFKPCIQVEMDHPDKPETVTEVFIRGWKIDKLMMEIFKQCWPSMEKLHSINLWNTGLTGETVHLMASFIPHCLNLRNVTLDGNPQDEENWFELLAEESPIQNLSLRHCNINNTGAVMIGRCLGSTKRSNVKLLSLNLSNNKITDTGLDALAQGLRMNRTLLSLSLSSNKIGDKGVQKLGEVLSRFPLTHEEVVERRRQKSDRSSPDRNKSPPLSRRADSKDRPGSVRSSTHADKDKKKEKPSAKKKDSKGKDEKEEKHDKTKGKKDKDDKGAKKVASSSSKPSSPDPGHHGHARHHGHHSKNQSGQAENRSRGSSTVGGRSSGASIAADAGKTAKGAKGGKGGKEKKPTQPDHETSDSPEFVNPLLEGADFIDGQLWVSGNRVLLNLNLSRNDVGEAGMCALLKAVQYQMTLLTDMKNSGTGLMRVVIGRNRISPDHEVVKKLMGLMLPRDPFYKPPPQTPDAQEH